MKFSRRTTQHLIGFGLVLYGMVLSVGVGGAFPPLSLVAVPPGLVMVLMGLHLFRIGPEFPYSDL